MEATRTLTIEFFPTPTQRVMLEGMFAASRRIYNQLVEHLQYKRNEYKRLKEADPSCKPYEVNSYLNLFQLGWAHELTRTFTNQEYSLYPQQLENKPAKQGKEKGVERLVIAVRKSKKPDYGIPAQSADAICRTFEAAIKACFTRRKRGDHEAELPKRFKSYYPVPFSGLHVKRQGDTLILGAKPYLLKLRLPELKGKVLDGDAKISKSRSGHYYLHLCTKHTVEPNPELTQVAAVDFGQKRAIVIAVQNGEGTAETATISGKDICALKRERDGRYRAINRARARVFKGQFRQYLSVEEKATYRRLQEEDNERQRQGKKRTGSDAKYAWRMIRQRRREGLDGKGRSLIALNQQSTKPLRRRSKRDYRLYMGQQKAADYYRIRLNYANHTITRTAVDWAVERKVGKIYVGDLDRLPKGRKKGNRRIKQVSRNNMWEMPTQAKYLEEKMQLAGGIGTEKASEAFTSQVCPQCGRRHKPRNRVYYCNPKHGGCGWRGDRDGVGSANFLSSVTYGTCGKLMPVQNRTLRIAPAIRQGLLMPEPNSQVQVTTVCEPAEDAAKGSPDSSGQGLTVVLVPPIPRTARNPHTLRRTQASGGKGMLVNSEIPDTARLRDTCSESATRKTGVSSRSSRKRLSKRLQNHIQLSLWELPCNDHKD
jgi:transposase